MLDTLTRINTTTLPLAALEYGMLGWRVFPLKERDKTPLVKWKDDATDDLDQLTVWWRKWPTANIGLVCGEKLWALDVDVKRNGLPNLATMEAQHESDLRNATLRQRTGGGGFHLLWNAPEGRGVRTTSDDAAMLPGLDTRGRGGYIVLAPSVHESGRKYQWEHFVEPADAPNWLLELVMAPVGGDRRQQGYTASGNVWRGGDIYDGRRTNVLFATACSQLGKGISPDQIRENIHALNHQFCRPRLTEEYVDKNILAGALAKESGFPWTELGLIGWIYDKFVQGSWAWARMGAGRRASGGWYRYVGTHWAGVSELEMDRLITDEAIMALRRKSEDDKDFRAFVNRRETQSGIEAVERGLRNSAQQEFERFSSVHNRHLLALANQTTIEFHKDGNWRIRPSSHEDWLSSILPVSYDPDAVCPTWDTALATWMQGDQERVNALWRWMAAMLSATRVDKLLLAVGEPRSGKTTFANALRHMMGEGLSCVLPTGLILQGKGINGMSLAHKENAKTLLLGKRLGVFSESATAVALDTEMVKSLAGGDKVTAKLMARDPISFEPTHQLLLHTNASPDSKGVDAALVERFAIFEWCPTIPEGERKPDMEEKLWAERSGALNRILAWYPHLAQKGLDLPGKVNAAAEPYRKLTIEATLHLWAEACLEDVDVGFSKNTALYNHYKRWCVTEGHGVMGKMDFYRRFDMMDYRKGGKDGYTVYWGVQVKESAQERNNEIVVGRN